MIRITYNYTVAERWKLSSDRELTPTQILLGLRHYARKSFGEMALMDYCITGNIPTGWFVAIGNKFRYSNPNRMIYAKLDTMTMDIKIHIDKPFSEVGVIKLVQILLIARQLELMGIDLFSCILDEQLKESIVILEGI